MMKFRDIRIVSEPAIEPIHISEFDEFMRLSGDLEEINTFKLNISSAREFIERYTGVAMITQTWRASFDAFPGVWPLASQKARFLLPISPVQSISSISYLDTDGAAQNVGSSAYRLQDSSVYLASGHSWPSAITGEGAISVTWVAGYGDSPGDVPSSYRQAVLRLAGWMTDNRVASPDPQIVNYILSLIPDRRIPVA